MLQLFSADDSHPEWTVNKQKKKTFDKTLRRFFLALNTHMSKLEYGKSPLYYRYMVFHIRLPQKLSFSLEFNVTDSKNRKKRLTFTSSAKTVGCTHTHAKVPASSFPKDTWTVFSIDIPSFVRSCFPGSEFKSVVSFTVRAYCKVIRVLNSNTPGVPVDGFRSFLATHEACTNNQSNWASKRASLTPVNRDSYTCYGRMETRPIECPQLDEEIEESIHISSSSDDGVEDNSHNSSLPMLQRGNLLLATMRRLSTACSR